MTIETSPAQNAPRPTAPEAKSTKAKAGEASASDAGSPGGFMAILASLDAPEPAASTDAVPGLPGTDPGALALAALQRAARQGDPADGANSAATPVDLQKLLQSVVVDADVAVVDTAAEIPWQSELPLDTSALLAQAAQWGVATAQEPAAEQVLPGAAKGTFTNATGAFNRGFAADKADGAVLASGALVDAASDVGGKAGKVRKDAIARLASAQTTSAVPAVDNSPAALARQAQILQRVTEAPLSPIASALATATLTVPARSEDAGRERSIFQASPAPDVASPAHTYAAPASTTSFAATAAPVVAMDAFVAEKVAYWISNDVQNAEMKLDGIGEMPVEVSIRMQGNEAHIAFRSDEQQARAALENASEQLKDLLQREGLVLSGVSVGTAGAGDAGDQERKPRQGVRQVGVVSAQPARADSLTGSRRSSGGALDLFV